MLYDTLNKNLPTDPPSKRLLKKLRKQLSTESEQKRIQAIVLLITEHAIRNDGYKVNPKKTVLPLGGRQVGRDTIFDLENIPVELQYILIKFYKIKIE